MIQRLYLVIPVLLLVSGCAHLGRQADTVPRPAGAPEIATVLQVLSANDAQVQRFQARGKLILKLPDRATILSFPNSEIHYSQPTQLYVVGRKYGATAVKLWSDADRFLLVLPREQAFYFRGTEEETQLSVSPAQVVRELFLSIPWEQTRKQDIQMTAHDKQTQTVTLEIWSTVKPRYVERRLEVQGPAWSITQSQLLDASGTVVATTRREGYRDINGINFPSQLETVFAGDTARLRFDLTEIIFNTPLNQETADINQAVDDVRRQGYQALEPERLEEAVQ